MASLRPRQLVLALLASSLAVPATASAQNGFTRFVGDVGRDYIDFMSVENVKLAAGGLVAAATTHFQDQEIAEDLAAPTPYALKPGATYGNLAFQVPLAVTWWAIGAIANSDRGASAGRDLLRAQISGASWTYLLKYAVDRTRPNGDPRSFPSGHATAAFATATVLQEHYGWKLGVPVYAAAAYVAAERVTENKHWPSDVVFGAMVGVMAGRTVTLHVRRERLLVQPHALPGGAGVMVHVQHAQR